MFPYDEEYFLYLLEKEKQIREKYQFKARSPQLSFRKGLVKSLKNLADKLSLAQGTFHLAVHLLDIFMDCHDIFPSQLMLTTSTCTLVAAKYVDIDHSIPRISKLQSMTNYQNSLNEYKIMEKVLLNFVKWDLNFVTAVHFLDYFLSSKLIALCECKLEQCTLNDLNMCAMELANLTLFHVQFIYFKPSVVAASCVAATRILFQLFPVWPTKLQQVTKYSYSDLDLCVQNLIQLPRMSNTESCIPVTPSWMLNFCQYKTDWKKCKCKAPPKIYNSAKSTRNLPKCCDLKTVYCAI